MATMTELRNAVNSSPHVKEQMFQHYFEADRYGSDEDAAREKFRNEMEHSARSQILISGYLRQYEHSLSQSTRQMHVQTRMIQADTGRRIIKNGIGIAVTGLVALIGSQAGDNETIKTVMGAAGAVTTVGGVATMLLGYIKYRV